MSLPKTKKRKSAALREHARRQKAMENREAKRRWRSHVQRRCAMCDHAPVSAEVRKDFHADLTRFEGHHVIPESDLRRMGYPPDVCFDPRIQVTLCSYHHQRHERWFDRMPLELVPASAYDFAAEHDLEWLLERENR